jgi:hypothetical protein
MSPRAQPSHVRCSHAAVCTDRREKRIEGNTRFLCVLTHREHVFITKNRRTGNEWGMSGNEARITADPKGQTLDLERSIDARQAEQPIESVLSVRRGIHTSIKETNLFSNPLYC